MNQELVNQLDEALHRIFCSMNLDRIPVHRENGSFSAKNLSIMETRILRMIDENQEVTLKEIRDEVNVPNSTLTSIIKKFENKELIVRDENPGDRRSYVLRITKYGSEINKAHRYYDKLIAQVFIERSGDDKQVRKFIELAMKVTKTPFFSMDDYCTYHDNKV